MTINGKTGPKKLQTDEGSLVGGPEWSGFLGYLRMGGVCQTTMNQTEPERIA